MSVLKSVVLQTLLLQALPLLRSNAHCFNETSMAVEQLGLSEKQFWRAKSHDLEQCAQLCVRRKPCFSLNYDSQSHICELNAGTKADTPTKTGKYLMYSEFQWWPASVDVDCYSRPCQDSEVCIPGSLTDGSFDCSYACEQTVRAISACGTVKAPMHGSIVYTNSRTTCSFSCYPGYALSGLTSIQCVAGSWDGIPPTCQDKDECTSSPCQNGGTCTNSIGSFMCACIAGFSGTSCEQDINECMSLPCINGGTCVNKVNMYECICTTVFTGVNCEQDVALLICPEMNACLPTTPREYNGEVTLTTNGRTCQRWDSQFPHPHPYTDLQYFPTGTTLAQNHNYCRNPVQDEFTPWCMTMDPNVQWEYCDVIQC